MWSKGSTAGFILSLIGGIFNILGGIGLIFSTIIIFWAAGFLGEPMGNSAIIILFSFALYFLIFGVWIIAAGFWMRKDTSLKKGAITSLILGILSLNVLAIIGGLIGLLSKDN
jgi:hypothetical protein